MEAVHSFVIVHYVLQSRALGSLVISLLSTMAQVSIRREGTRLRSIPNWWQSISNVFFSFWHVRLEVASRRNVSTSFACFRSIRHHCSLHFYGNRSVFHTIDG